MFYRIFRLLAAIALRLFFRRIEVEGAEEVPTAGPLLLTPNHTNALVDPLLPLIVLPRRITLTAKNVLSKNPLLAFLFWGLDTVAFHRQEDIAKGASPRENVRSMQRCREILSRGCAVCIFPEGVSHSDMKMREFHNGPARLAVDFVRKDKNPGGLRIVPVGLLYSHKERFRSDVLVRFGPAIDAAAWLAAHPKADAAVLTEELRRQIEALTVNYDTRREMLLVHWAEALVAAEGRMPRALGSRRPAVAEAFQRLARLQAGYRELLPTHQPEIDSLAERIGVYQAALKQHGVTPEEVYLPLHPLRAALFVVRELELIVAGFPLAAFGVINHAVPYLVVRTIARRLSTDKDHWATNVIYPSFVVFPFFYLAQLMAAWFFLPHVWALVYTLALPYTGCYCLLYRDRAAEAWRRARTFVHFLVNRPAQAHLAAEGRGILQAVYGLAAELHDPPPLPAGLHVPPASII